MIRGKIPLAQTIRFVLSVDAQEVDAVAQKTSAIQLLSCERTLRAVELRKQGATYVAIGSELGVSPQAVHKRVAKVLKVYGEEIQEARKTLRALEAARLDALQEICWEYAQGGNLMAVDRVLRIMERRAKLLGLDGQEPPEHESFEDLVERVTGVMRGYADPMPSPDDDGSTVPEWVEPGARALTDFIDVEPVTEQAW